MRIPPWVSEYIEIPFEDHGRTRSGCDCYGLLRLVLNEQFGHTLPEFGNGYSDFGDRDTEARLIEEGLPLIGAHLVPLPAEGDIVLLEYFGTASHVGVYLGHHRMLHTERGKGTHIADLATPHYEHRIVGYYHVD